MQFSCTFLVSSAFRMVIADVFPVCFFSFSLFLFYQVYSGLELLAGMLASTHLSRINEKTVTVRLCRWLLLEGFLIPANSQVVSIR
jgi:hypothetical protein